MCLIVPELMITIIYVWYLVRPVLTAITASPPIDTSGFVNYAVDPTLSAVVFR